VAGLERRDDRSDEMAEPAADDDKNASSSVVSPASLLAFPASTSASLLAPLLAPDEVPAVAKPGRPDSDDAASNAVSRSSSSSSSS
jgi:hypothetical protein